MARNAVSKNPLEGLLLPEKKKKDTQKNKQLHSQKTPTPRSFRMSFSDLDALKDTTESVSELAGPNVKINDTLVVRSLVRLAVSMDHQEILDEIRRLKMEM